MYFDIITAFSNIESYWVLADTRRQVSIINLFHSSFLSSFEPSKDVPDILKICMCPFRCMVTIAACGGGPSSVFYRRTFLVSKWLIVFRSTEALYIRIGLRHFLKFDYSGL